MKRAARLVIVALWVAEQRVCHAQDGRWLVADGGDGMGRAFGRGNGVRGTVTAAAAGSFTIRTDEGETYQVLYSANTRLIKDRQPIEAADVHVGDMLMAGGIVDPKAKTVGAVFVLDIDAKEVRNARAAFGKTWVVGKVTAIHELKITIERAGDKQAQTVAVDENTSFRKHREDVTLADVKVGDTITAQGALHADTFLATEFRIMPPRTGGRGPDESPANHLPGFSVRHRTAARPLNGSAWAREWSNIVLSRGRSKLCVHSHRNPSLMRRMSLLLCLLGGFFLASSAAQSQSTPGRWSRHRRPSPAGWCTAR